MEDTPAPAGDIGDAGHLGHVLTSEAVLFNERFYLVLDEPRFLTALKMTCQSLAHGHAHAPQKEGRENTCWHTFGLHVMTTAGKLPRAIALRPRPCFEFFRGRKIQFIAHWSAFRMVPAVQGKRTRSIIRFLVFNCAPCTRNAELQAFLLAELLELIPTSDDEVAGANPVLTAVRAAALLFLADDSMHVQQV